MNKDPDVLWRIVRVDRGHLVDDGVHDGVLTQLRQLGSQVSLHLDERVTRVRQRAVTFYQRDSVAIDVDVARAQT